VRLPLGRGTQAYPARPRGPGMSAQLQAIPERPDLESLDWARVATDLDARGNAVLPGLLSARQCDELANLYPHGDLFRSRVVMGRHGFGRGEYKYFAYPLPDLVDGLREALYPQLAPIANRWNEA